MSKLIGRKQEEKVLQEAWASKDAELIALYGRRRVGKTYLVRQFFHMKKDTLFFYVSGINGGSLRDQTQNFLDELAATFWYKGPRDGLVGDWRNIFRLLTEVMRLSSHKKIVLFFDEFPWMVTRRSKLLQMLDYFWNRHWSMDPRVKLVICGSSASWLVKNIINNRGGLYNRVTRSIHLQPFNLHQVQSYLSYKNIKLSKKDIVDLYMVLGGIPFYLSKVKSGLSVSQVIDDLGFQKGSFLLSEFANLYDTLFGSGGAHRELARIIAQHRYGVSQKELFANLSTSSGGTLTRWLNDLELAGFISRFTPFASAKKGVYYRMTDEYSLFYFKWIEPIKNTLIEKAMRKGYWSSIKATPSWSSWAGYAFEGICLKHAGQLSMALELSPLALPHTWRYVPKKGEECEGAQIDLLFDRNDNVITLCEIKYTQNPFVFDKKALEKLLHAVYIFKEKTKTSKNIFVALISAQGIKKTLYSDELVHHVVTLADLFVNGS